MRTLYRFEQYTKAGLIFAATTATYFFARATGVLPSWFNWEKTENTDLIASDEINSPILESTHFVADTLYTDEFLLSESVRTTQRHLLQQASVSVVNPIPDQVIEVNQQYTYPLNNVFFRKLYALGGGRNKKKQFAKLVEYAKSIAFYLQ
jgi:hypothetical protein